MAFHPNLRHVRLFSLCLSVGSMTEAASRMGVSQPAASQALARLETDLAAPLLERRRGALSATAEGALFARRAERALALVRAGCAALARQRPVPGGATVDAQAPRQETRQETRLEHRLTTPHLRALSAFAEAESFAGAARLLGLSEPAVQRMARHVEALLEVPLFEGPRHALHFSAAGREVARWSALALKELENAADELREARGEFAGLVAVGTLPLARTQIVPDAVSVVAQRHPRARFEILEGEYNRHVADLERGRIDLLVGALRDGPPGRGLVQEPILDFDLAVVARAGHPLDGRAGIGPAEMAAFPWIVARRGTPSRGTFEELAQGFPPDMPARRSVETGSLVAIRGLLTRGDHLALLSAHQVQYEIRSGLLTTLDAALPGNRRPMGITTRRGWMPTALMSEFVAALRQAARDLG
ncbi:LysR substrate-binding domain-containing protein [Halodurantibacterium flavum]|uniref:LysR substrate-binding domain-containing protein n=1 Tax=Halodurantibacterium flavum TaxID=1382802 RepID=A0ABW4S3W4_9RHOB